MNSEKEIVTCPSEEVEGMKRRAGEIPEHPLQNVSTLSLGGALWASAQRLHVSLLCCQLVCRVFFFILLFVYLFRFDYLWASLVVQMVKNLPATQETWVRSMSWEDPLEKGTATHSSILAWRIPMDRGASWTTVHGVAKSWAWLSD